MKTILEEFGPKAQPGREVGVEIEMEGHKFPMEVPYWNAIPDGSLRGESIEYVFTNPQPRDKVGRVLETLEAMLKKAGTAINDSDRCGVHVHVNCQDLNTQQVLNFIILYLILEDILVRYCGEPREGNLFCLRAQDAEYLLQGLAQAQERGSLQKLQQDVFRYASVNVSAIGKYGSLEFRAMRTTADFSIIKNWVSILLAIKDTSLRYENPQDLVTGLSMRGASDFLRMVMGDLYELVQCPGQDKMLMDGARRAQEVAYVKRVKGKKAEDTPIYGDFDPAEAIREAIHRAPPPREPRVAPPAQQVAWDLPNWEIGPDGRFRERQP